jgi:aryl-alcohol dehydrogenase-like predicted oxidoreductase
MTMEDACLSRRAFVRQSAAGATALAAGAAVVHSVAPVRNAAAADTGKIVNYNPDMEYRLCGKTGWMISAVCLGGHWKRVNQMVPGLFEGDGWLNANVNNPGFAKNRYDVVSRCIERGINYIDACTHSEILAYSKALKGRRDKMHLGWSWYENEARRGDRRSPESLVPSLEAGMKECGEDYVDLWRITCNVDGRVGPDGRYVMTHTPAESEGIVAALDKARKSGKARHTGVSSHDRVWLTYMMEKFPDQIDVVVTPYTAKTKVLPTESFFDAVRRCNCGFFGIKPFASASVFKGDSSPESPFREEDDRIARLALRYILCNPSITAPIPGMINPQQVDNVALAAKERRELDVEEKAELDRAMNRAWANLPFHYRWLKDWEYV